MKELFPLKTFHQDAVLKRLSELYENEKDLDNKMPYDEDTDTYSIDGDLEVTGDVKAKTFLQEDYNWQSANIALNADYLNGITVVSSYCRAVQINKRLDIIISVYLLNETESDITTLGSKALLQTLTIPEDISKLIYRKDGSTCDQAKDNWDGILSTSCVCTRRTTGVATIIPGLFSCPTATHFTIFMPSGSVFTVKAGEYHCFDVRFSILL